MLKKMFATGLLCIVMASGQALAESYPIVDTGQDACFNNSRQIACPDPGNDFNGQDGQYRGNTARYLDNGDGTVSDRVTGLMWVKTRGGKMSFRDAVAGAATCRVGGYDDWRAPTIKELYSLMDFNGWSMGSGKGSRPFIDTRYFDFAYGDTSKGERAIDCQDWSTTEYVHTTMGGSATAFGVNFADGRIKGYGVGHGRHTVNKYIRYVRGNPDYGESELANNGDGTISDTATGLIWQKADNGKGVNWENALAYCENLALGGKSDWRLPNAKELQSIVDYTRSPKTTHSPAIDPMFSNSDTEGWYWSSTTHLDGPRPENAVYVAFGRAMGYFAPPGRGNLSKRYMDVHGAGAQRSDPKSGRPASGGHGPQGDEQRVTNFVRCVRGGGVEYYEPEYKRLPEWQGGRQGADSGMSMRSNRDRSSTMQPRSQQGERSHTRQQGQSRRQGPPQEAFDACNGSYQGDTCTIQTPHGTLSGLCRDMPDGLVCVPEGGHGGRHGPRIQ